MLGMTHDQLLLAEYEAALNKILKSKTLERAKIVASDALGLDAEDFLEEEDYLDEGDDLVELFNG